MLRLRYICLLLLATTLTNTYAQQAGWLPGYVVTIQGDTFRGTIKMGNNIFSDARYDACHEVKFKNPRGIRIYFTPPFVKSYVRGADEYFTYRAPQGKEVWSVFIKRLVKGPVDLYVYYGERKSFMYFLKKPGDKFIILESDSPALLFDRVRIKAMLLDYFKDCPMVVKKIDDGTFNIYHLHLKDIPKMVDEYNGCVK